MKNDTFSFTITGSSSGSAHILLEGQLVIKNAKAIKEHFLQALPGYQHFEIVFRDVVKIDLTILQLLVAFQKTAVSQGKKVSINIDSSDQLNLIVRQAGFGSTFLSPATKLLNGIH